MFFILEHRRNNRFNQLGVVVSESVEEAASKIGMDILEVIRPPESSVIYALIRQNYSLTEMPEITSRAGIADEDESGGKRSALFPDASEMEHLHFSEEELDR